MGGAGAGRPNRAGARLVASLALVAICLLTPLLPADRASAAVCFGDEQLLIAPTQPHTGEIMVIAAVSRFPHDQVAIHGPNGAIGTQVGVLGDRFVWQGTVIPEVAGAVTFQFGLPGSAGIMAVCTEAVTTILELDLHAPASAAPSATAEASALFASLHPWAAAPVNGSVSDASPAPTDTPDIVQPTGADSTPTDQAASPARPASTRRPTRTPEAAATDNDNGAENDNAADPTPTRTPSPTRSPTRTNEPTLTREPTSTRTPADTRTPSPTRTPEPTDTPRPTPTYTPEPTATLAPPTITLPESALCGKPLTIRGERLGSSKQAVSGDVKVDGRQADVISWSMEEVKVWTPLTARPGNGRVVQIQVAGKIIEATLRLNCS